MIEAAKDAINIRSKEWNLLSIWSGKSLASNGHKGKLARKLGIKTMDLTSLQKNASSDIEHNFYLNQFGETSIFPFFLQDKTPTIVKAAGLKADAVMRYIEPWQGEPYGVTDNVYVVTFPNGEKFGVNKPHETIEGKDELLRFYTVAKELGATLSIATGIVVDHPLGLNLRENYLVEVEFGKFSDRFDLVEFIERQFEKNKDRTGGLHTDILQDVVDMYSTLPVTVHAWRNGISHLRDGIEKMSIIDYNSKRFTIANDNLETIAQVGQGFII